MPPGKTFSGKQKKEQLKVKRERKRAAALQHTNNSTTATEEDDDDVHPSETLNRALERSQHKSSFVHPNASSAVSSGRPPKGIPHELLTSSLGTSNVKQNKLSTLLAKEKKELVEARKIASALPIDVSARNHPLYARDRREEHTNQRNAEGQAILDHPKGVLLREGQRGRSTYTAVNARTIEEQSFNTWLQNIYGTYSRNDLNMFEHNLDVWMQLWHTLATADIIAILADVRNPLWHIPYSLYHQIINELKKPLIIVLSKCDLVPTHVSEAWCEWMRTHYPEVKVVRFTASGGYVGDITALAQRKRQLRSARLSHDECHVNQRIQSAKDLLQAANVSESAIEYVERKLRGTMKQSIARSNVKLSVDQNSVSSSIRAPVHLSRNTENNDDLEESEKEEEDYDEDRSFDIVRISETDDDDDSDDHDSKEIEEPNDNGITDDSSNDDDHDNNANEEEDFDNDTNQEFSHTSVENSGTNKEDENNSSLSSSSSSSSSDGFLRSNHRFNENSNNRTKPPVQTKVSTTVTTKSTTTATIEQTKTNPSGGSKKKAKGIRKGKHSDSDEGIDRFTGRPRHYKRGDADIKATEIAKGFRTKVAISAGINDSDDEKEDEQNKKTKNRKDGSGRTKAPPGKLMAKTNQRITGDPSGKVHNNLNVPRPKKKTSTNDNSDEDNDDDTVPAGPTEEELAIKETLQNQNVPTSTTSTPSSSSSSTVKRPLTIGFVGHPNVGKSSIINTLCGEKRVSVSRTAGHTKRAQTIHLVPSSNPNNSSNNNPDSCGEPVDLLDCPGLVFPHLLNYSAVIPLIASSHSSSVTINPGTEILHDENERAMQECCGVIPLAQVREPYTSIRFLMEHLPIERYYGILPPRDEVREAEEEGREFRWSSLSLCEAYAVKRGYYIARTGRPDSHSAGRSILYDTQDGIIPLWWLPPK